MLAFWCPGCEYEVPNEGTHGGAHLLPISDPGDGRPVWTFTGTVESPTLSPSVLSNIPFRWVNGEASSFICHSFLREGKLEFLGDCTHQYANQTVPLPPMPDWLVKEN